MRDREDFSSKRAFDLDRPNLTHNLKIVINELWQHEERILNLEKELRDLRRDQRKEKEKSDSDENRGTVSG